MNPLSKNSDTQTPDDNAQENSRAEMSSEERNWGMFCHLSTFAGIFIPFGNIIAPLVIWLTQREAFPFVDDQGKEAINFQITMTIAFLVSLLSLFILVGFILLPALALFDLIITVIACMKASEGITYRYPICIRFIT